MLSDARMPRGSRDSLIPIVTKAASEQPTDDPVVPATLADDPDLGDGSVGRGGVQMSEWRVNVLRQDSLVGMTEYDGDDKRSRAARRAQKASRNARTERGRRSRRRIRVGVALVIVLVMAVLAGVAGSYALELWGGRAVPNVDGLTQGNAVELLERKGFSVTVQGVLSDSLEGRVVGVDPTAGTRLEEGSTVQLSIGQSRHIPDVVGMSSAEAQAALAEVGAQNVQVEPLITLEDEEDVVREVSPAPGAVFMSVDEVKIVVSQHPRVPDLMGMDEENATALLERYGLPYTVAYEQVEADRRMQVVRLEPDVNAPLEQEQQVTVVVGDPLMNIVRVKDFFDAPANRVREYVLSQGFELQAARRMQAGHVMARYYDHGKLTLSFVADPWSRKVEEDQAPPEEVLDESASIDGVRLSVSLERATIETVVEQPNPSQPTLDPITGEPVAAEPTKTTTLEPAPLSIENPMVNEETAAAVRAVCGLGEPTSTCTQDTVLLPQGTPRVGHNFYCCAGEEDGLVWTVLLRGAEGSGVATQAVITCAPRSAYSKLDLSLFGDRICNFVAYHDEYAN